MYYFSGNIEAPTTLSLSLTSQVSIKLYMVKKSNRATLNLC